MDHEAEPWAEFGGCEEPLLSPDFARKVLRRARAERRGGHLWQSAANIAGGAAVVCATLAGIMVLPSTQNEPIKLVDIDSSASTPAITRDLAWVEAPEHAPQADPFLVFLPDAQSVMDEIAD
jgi:hypothetical protein